MQHAFRFLLGLALAAPLFASAQTGRDIGTVSVNADTTTTPISISSSSPELQDLALRAFGAHGRYKVVAGGGAFALAFSPAGANQVSVTITKGGTTVASQAFAGSDMRNALLKAADFAVNKTSGLKGFFAGKLAFVSDKSGKTEIYTSDLFFGDVLRWTSEGKQILGPRWSPDGTKIIFTSYRTSFPDIYVLELTNRRISLYASFKGTNSGGRYSPNGSQVAMVLSGEGNPEVYVGNAQGRQIHRLTNNQFVEASPAWSPDGTRLCVVSDSPGRPQLFMMSAGGGGMTRITSGVSTYCAEPDWSVGDPNKIAFTAAVGKGYQIGVWDLASRSGKVVSNAPKDAIEPMWMADGRHVICSYRAANTSALYLLDTESGKATRLSPTAMGNASSASYLAP